MSGNLNFDATQVEPAGDMSPVPPGTYEAIIGTTEIKDTRNQDGQYLSIEHIIDGGDFHGRKFWNNLNLWNKSDQAVEIAQRTLSAICHAIGKLRIANHEELFGQKLLAVVEVEPDNKGRPRNVVKAYKPLSEAGASPAPAGAPRTAAAASGTVKKAAPWQK